MIDIYHFTCLYKVPISGDLSHILIKSTKTHASSEDLDLVTKFQLILIRQRRL